MPNFLAFQSELNLWEEYWSTYKGCISDNLISTIKATHCSFDNLMVCLRILATLPVTSCECESSFSVLRQLKNYKRNTMTSERLNGLALMYVHTEIVPEVDDVIDKFSVNNRKLNFK